MLLEFPYLSIKKRKRVQNNHDFSIHRLDHMLGTVYNKSVTF